MPITMRCPGCQTRFDFADDLEGKRIKCKSCGDIFRVAGDAPPKKARDDDDDDDRYGNRSRRRDDNEDDRPAARSRRRDDDENEQPSRYRRGDPDDDRRRRRRSDEDDDRPAKKRLNPLIIILPIGGTVLLAGVITLVVVMLGNKKKGGSGPGGDTAVAVSRSCPLEVPEKEAGFLVLPDSGSTFGLLRKAGMGRGGWSFDEYDLSARKKTATITLTDVEDPKAWSLSPNGKQLLLTEIRGLGWAGDSWLWRWPLAGGKADKWFPFQKDDKRGFNAPALYRAEFAANDKILTLGNTRQFFVYSLPTFETLDGSIGAVEKEGLGKRGNAPHEFEWRVQWEVAFSADRKKMAVWTGDGYTLVNTADGTEAGGCAGVRSLARAEWGNTAGDPNKVKGGPAAFNPDGSVLAAVVQGDFSNKRLLCLWNTADGQMSTFYRLPENQWLEAASIHWWGKNFIATFGAKALGESVGSVLIDVKTGEARRQLMPPLNMKYGFSRDGKLWWAASEDRAKPAVLNVADSLDPSLVADGEAYEKVPDLGPERFLRRLWLEPSGVLKQPTRDDPPIRSRLIRQP
jgi:hypothetical protein